MNYHLLTILYGKKKQIVYVLLHFVKQIFILHSLLEAAEGVSNWQFPL